MTARRIWRAARQCPNILQMCTMILTLTVCSCRMHTTPTHAQLDQLLRYPTENVRRLHLLVHRGRDFHADANNVYMYWFLRKQHILLKVGTYELGASMESMPYLNETGNSFVIATKMKYLEEVALQFAQRGGNYFFIITDAVLMNELMYVMHFMWRKHKVFKNYVLCSKGVFVYDPFDYDVHHRRYGRVISYTGEWRLEHKLFNDMRGYPLRVQIFQSVFAIPKINEVTKRIYELKGVDAKVALYIRDKMNFTMRLQKPDPQYFGYRDEQGNYNGVIGSIINDGLDLCFTGFFVKDYMAPELQFTVAVYDDQLCLYVPKAKRIPQSILPIFSVGFDIWLLYICAAFVCAILWAGMRYANISLHSSRVQDVPCTGINFYWQFIRILIDTWVVWVRANVVRYPPFRSERIFLASLCLISVILGAIFESSLATVYIHPMYYKDINTLRELDESGFPVVYKYASMADDLFFSETSTLFANLNKKLKFIGDLDADIMWEVATRGGMAGVTRQTTINLYSIHFILMNKLWILRECPKYYTISYTMPKGSPWEETVNRHLLRIISVGFIKKWIRDMQSEADIETMKLLQNKIIDVFKVLTIDDLQLAFYVVLLGNVLATVAFFVESFILKKTELHTC